MTDVVGQTLGQYRVIELIGQGGMARVYKGYQPSLARNVAIKAIPTQIDNTRDNEFAQRFVFEARMIARLTHPNIVPVHDYGEDKGWAFIVMEYISGGTLRNRIAAAEAHRVRLELAPTLDLLAQAALALEFAHSNGIIHRDVKPANMLLRTEDHLLLSDFGIAALLEANRAFTRTGANVGTPQYMAPEQGIPDGVIDARTDIYALGVVTYQCVTGALPFPAESPMAIVMRHIKDPVPRPSFLVANLPIRVEQIILRAMEKNPANRFQHAREMAEQLREAAYEVRRGYRHPQLTMKHQSLPNSASPVGNSNDGNHFIPLPTLGVPGQPGTCLRCGAANSPRNRFCTNCAYDLSGARARADHYKTPNGHPLRCRIIIRNGPMTNHAFVLHQDITTLGRTAGNDVVIQDATVSRYHARLFFHSGQWCIEDLQSANGTYVNGKRVQRPIPLQHGDELRLGDDIVTFEMLG
ncbi:MAG: protein kinase domain-containing protein [Ktedonobacterales bacterium]